MHVNQLRQSPQLLKNFQFLAIPGGFSYGDDIAGGRVFANELNNALGDHLHAFVDQGGYAIGICNGFQTLVKSGLLPRIDGGHEQTVTLTDNTSGRYIDRWVTLTGDPQRCAWVPDDEPIELPVAHAEGRFQAPAEIRQRLAADHQIAFTYGDNFNGSDDAIAGICDPSGRVLGLMPHPERFLRWENHPQWTRLSRRREGDGVRLFRAAVRHAKEKLIL